MKKKKYKTFSDRLAADWEGDESFVYAPSTVDMWFYYDDPSLLRNTDMALFYGYGRESCRLRFHNCDNPREGNFYDGII